MDTIPIIELRVRDLGEQIVAALAAHSDELLEHVECSVKQLSSSGNFQRLIDEEVKKQFKSALEVALGSYEVRCAMVKVIKNVAVSKITGEPTEESGGN